jgi:hypothetical protein
MEAPSWPPPKINHIAHSFLCYLFNKLSSLTFTSVKTRKVRENSRVQLPNQKASGALHSTTASIGNYATNCRSSVELEQQRCLGGWREKSIDLTISWILTSISMTTPGFLLFSLFPFSNWFWRSASKQNWGIELDLRVLFPKMGTYGDPSEQWGVVDDIISSIRSSSHGQFLARNDPNTLIASWRPLHNVKHDLACKTLLERVRNWRSEPAARRFTHFHRHRQFGGVLPQFIANLHCDFILKHLKTLLNVTH